MMYQNQEEDVGSFFSNSLLFREQYEGYPEEAEEPVEYEPQMQNYPVYNAILDGNCKLLTFQFKDF